MLKLLKKNIRFKTIVPCAWRAFGVLGSRALSMLEHKRANHKTTYLVDVEIDASDFPCFFSLSDPSIISEKERKVISELSSNFMEHRFDLLGSGWIEICRGMKPKGLMGVRFDSEFVADAGKPFSVNDANREEAVRIWSEIKKENYKPIHWHIAYRSGYEWSPKIWKTGARKNLPRGVDIKEPWELSRMQHLVVMAVNAAQNPELRDRIAEEIECQILDFISNNPPSFGVNWSCTMDVALRTCSWLITYDLCRDAGVQFGRGFLDVFGRSIYEHAEFISTHMEWSDLTRGNHYIMDLIGLIFCCAYLPKTKKTENWLGFSIREFFREVNRQINLDGTGFECSTGYHCFVSEAFIYTVSLLMALLRNRKMDQFEIRSEGVGDFLLKRIGIARSRGGRRQLCGDITDEGLSGDLTKQLLRVKIFIENVTRPDGNILNIGDNDSGFFVKLGNRYCAGSKRGSTAPELQDLSRLHIAEIMDDFLRGGSSSWVSHMLPAKLKNANVLNGFQLIRQESEGKKANYSLFGRFDREVHFSDKVNGVGLRLCAYEDFGLYILKNDELFVAVRTFPGRNQIVGHRHDDNLSVAVSVGRQNRIDDPGIPYYTPFPEIAAKYRSAEVHYSPKGIKAVDILGANIRLGSNSIVVARANDLLLGVFVEHGSIKISSDYDLPESKDGFFALVKSSRGYGRIDNEKTI